MFLAAFLSKEVGINVEAIKLSQVVVAAVHNPVSPMTDAHMRRVVLMIDTRAMAAAAAHARATAEQRCAERNCMLLQGKTRVWQRRAHTGPSHRSHRRPRAAKGGRPPPTLFNAARGPPEQTVAAAVIENRISTPTQRGGESSVPSPHTHPPGTPPPSDAACRTSRRPVTPPRPAVGAARPLPTEPLAAAAEQQRGVRRVRRCATPPLSITACRGLTASTENPAAARRPVPDGDGGKPAKTATSPRATPLLRPPPCPPSSRTPRPARRAARRGAPPAPPPYRGRPVWLSSSTPSATSGGGSVGGAAGRHLAKGAQAHRRRAAQVGKGGVAGRGRLVVTCGGATSRYGTGVRVASQP